MKSVFKELEKAIIKRRPDTGEQINGMYFYAPMTGLSAPAAEIFHHICFAIDPKVDSLGDASGPKLAFNNAAFFPAAQLLEKLKEAKKEIRASVTIDDKMVQFKPANEADAPYVWNVVRKLLGPEEMLVHGVPAPAEARLKTHLRLPEGNWKFLDKTPVGEVVDPKTYNRMIQEYRAGNRKLPHDFGATTRIAWFEMPLKDAKDIAPLLELDLGKTKPKLEKTR